MMVMMLRTMMLLMVVTMVMIMLLVMVSMRWASLLAMPLVPLCRRRRRDVDNTFRGPDFVYVWSSDSG